MNCLWSDIPDSADARGWRQVKCQRCGLVLHPTPHQHEKIHSECKAWPWWWEFGHILSLALEAFGLSKTRWLWLRSRLGLTKPCGCERREGAANAIGRWLARLLGLPGD